MDFEIFTLFTFNQNTKRKNRSKLVADSNHEPLDPKSFNFQLSHEEVDDFRWSKSQFNFSVDIVGARGTPGQASNHEENTLF